VSETIRLGHRLELYSQAGEVLYKFQNWYLQDGPDGYTFLPFGFSGATFSREGDNITAALVLPVDGAVRSWAQEAIKDQWIANVEVSVFPDDSSQEPQKLHSYVGQISSSAWDETSIQLEMSTVLDAVQNDVPRRSLHQKLVGRLPTTGNIALS
tara:strand:+ start:14572 stop:15033 length:462 start_codon:yes stop_codon:yes gene_type:complete